MYWLVYTAQHIENTSSKAFYYLHILYGSMGCSFNKYLLIILLNKNDTLEYI